MEKPKLPFYEWGIINSCGNPKLSYIGSIPVMIIVWNKLEQTGINSIYILEEWCVNIVSHHQSKFPIILIMLTSCPNKYCNLKGYKIILMKIRGV